MAEKYPIGTQSFVKIIENGATYVDKTHFIHLLLKEQAQFAYFFSRPRRFGKSLLISTLKCIFEGRKELFKDLYIYDKIAWETYPIIHLSMSDLNFVDLGLKEALERNIKNIAQDYEVQLPEDPQSSLLRELLIVLYKKYEKKVVILIDEYDKPITHGLEANDSILAEKNRDILKSFYAGLKDADEYLRFLFITGIAKFAKVSIFSELNHLIDITLDKRFATLCGYTQAELEHYFPEGIQRLADENELTKEECLAKVKDWYNGFSWDGKNFVYNPFSTLLLLNSGQFENYWFATGTPTFLVKMLNARFEFEHKNLVAKSTDFDLFDFRNLPPRSILLQAGYLTIKEKKEDKIFIIDFPNKEVREAFNEMLIADYCHTPPGDSGITLYHIESAFKANDLPQVIKIMQTLFADVPYQLYEKKDINGNIKEVGENFFHAVIYLIFNTLGVKIQSEVSVNMGRIDAVVEMEKHIYLFEFKKNQKPLTAINQMKKKGYAEKYAQTNKTIHLIGVSFSLEKRNLDKWKEVII